MPFWTYPLRFLISNKLQQLELKLEKNIGIQKSAGKVRKLLSTTFQPITNSSDANSNPESTNHKNECSYIE